MYFLWNGCLLLKLFLFLIFHIFAKTHLGEEDIGRGFSKESNFAVCFTSFIHFENSSDSYNYNQGFKQALLDVTLWFKARANFCCVPKNISNFKSDLKIIISLLLPRLSLNP